MSHFKTISTTKASDVIPVTKYVSEKTGLHVIIGEAEGPVVNGYFYLATEAHDDDGLPHTLEHLIFLGSQRYPYKGVLDLLANRCMAHGTNAWTETDHTCYTIETAGDAGMLTLLPIYLDHILNPTLTDQGFITEVHHVDGDGEDAGVVYCEMQGRENNAGSRCQLRLLRALYPDSGYSAETGGIMKNLRESTDNIKVRDFHKKFYRPENLYIVLVGQIKAEDVFDALSIVEDDIIAKREKEPQEEWVKPWQTIPPPPRYGELTEQWPSDVEDCGHITFGWRGPTLTDPNSQKELTSCSLLLRYMGDTAAAPLQRCLVEREDALAGAISYNLIENISSAIVLEIENVPIDKLPAARDEAKKCLEALRSGAEALDMERIKRLVKKQLRETLASLEYEPHNAIAFMCIADSLYAQNEKEFSVRLNPERILNALLQENEDYWRGLLKTYFGEDMVAVIGSPSIDLQTKMADDEKKRIETQRQTLGESGLAEKAKLLEDATEFNSRLPPPGTLAAVPVPSLKNLKYHSITTWSTDSDPCPYFDLTEVPLYTRLHHIKTNFVYMCLVLDMTSASQETRRWLPLLMDALAECPVRRGDELVPHEQVISATEQLAVGCASSVGIGGGGNFSVGAFGNLVMIKISCQPEDYEEVVNHFYEVLYCAEITKERLQVFGQRLLNDVAQVRRNGRKMAADMLRDSLYSADSNMHWCSVLRQQKFLKELMEQLAAGGDSAQRAVAEARAAFAAVTRALWLDLAADLQRRALRTAPWRRFARGAGPPALPQLYMDSELMSGWGGGFVVGVGGLESAFLTQFASGPDRYCVDYAAPLAVALTYFTQFEGPMWRLLRGCGLTYSYSLHPMTNEGVLVFTLDRATNVVIAYIKAKAIIEVFLRTGDIDSELFESARSTALFDAVQASQTPTLVVGHALLDYVRRAPEGYSRDLVGAIAAVTPQMALAAVAKWLPTMFAVEHGKIAVSCAPSKVKDLQAAFEKYGVKLDAFESMEQSHLNK